MGSEYDYFGNRSRVDLEAQLIEQGEINQRELLNRQLLREVMTEAGWIVEPSEWWHFNAMTLEEASQKLSVID
jgi:D-alanyl-D-alanine dipeptidase